MTMEERDMDQESRRCVECAFCDLRVDLERGSSYFCLKTRTPLASDVIHRLACRSFQPAAPSGHWGP